MSVCYELFKADSHYIADAIKLRIEVFVVEQKVPIALEIDQYDADCLHLLMFEGDTPDAEPIGTLRLVDMGGYVKLGRLVVKKSHRGLGWGAGFVRHAVDVSRRLGFGRMELDAQTVAMPFYGRLGFEAFGPEFDDAGIAHRKMKRSLLAG